MDDVIGVYGDRALDVSGTLGLQMPLDGRDHVVLAHLVPLRSGAPRRLRRCYYYEMALSRQEPIALVLAERTKRRGRAPRSSRPRRNWFARALAVHAPGGRPARCFSRDRLPLLPIGRGLVVGSIQ